MQKRLNNIRDFVLSLKSNFINHTLNTNERTFLVCAILLFTGIFLWATLKLFNLEYLNSYMPRWLVYFWGLTMSMIFMDLKNYFDSQKEKIQLYERLFLEAMERDANGCREKNEYIPELHDLEFQEEERLHSRLFLEAMERDANGYREKNEYIPELHDLEFQKTERLNSALMEEAFYHDLNRSTDKNEVYLEEYFLERPFKEEKLSLDLIEKPSNWFSSLKDSKYKYVDFDLDNRRLFKIFSTQKDLNNFVRFLNYEELSVSERINITSYPGSRKRNTKTVFGILYYGLGDYMKEVSGAELKKLLNDICNHFTNNSHVLKYDSVNSAFSDWRGLLFKYSSSKDRKKAVNEYIKIARVFNSELQKDQIEKNLL